MSNLSERGITPQAWEAFVYACRKNPMDIDLQGVQELLDRLNTKSHTTDYEFHLHVLEQLPTSVRSGNDENYEVYQIRLDDYNSLEHVMATTTLLTVFLNIRPEGGRCYLLPNDPDSVQNWGVLLNIHAEQFPQLPSNA